MDELEARALTEMHGTGLALLANSPQLGLWLGVFVSAAVADAFVTRASAFVAAVSGREVGGCAIDASERSRARV